MDLVFLELIGKLKLKKPKIISVIAENFSLIDFQAQFLRATISLPDVKQLPFPESKILIQFGPIHYGIQEIIENEGWTFFKYQMSNESDLCQKIWSDLATIKTRSIVFINSVSSFELCQTDESQLSVIKLCDRLKRLKGHFVIPLYQGPIFQDCNEISQMKQLEYISDAVIRVQSCVAGFYKKILWQQAESKTLLPNKMQTSYFTCKVAKFNWKNLLCFCDRKQVSHTYDPATNTERDSVSDNDSEYQDSGDDGDERVELNTISAKNDEDNDDIVLPYTRAQNPDQSRIFYYPDKDDDIDEDDPDNDLGI